MCDLHLTLYIFLDVYVAIYVISSWQCDYQILASFRMQPTTRISMGGNK
jgi:hypothetical protein